MLYVGKKKRCRNWGGVGKSKGKMDTCGDPITERYPHNASRRVKKPKWGEKEQEECEKKQHPAESICHSGAAKWVRKQKGIPALNGIWTSMAEVVREGSPDGVVIQKHWEKIARRRGKTIY